LVFTEGLTYTIFTQMQNDSILRQCPSPDKTLLPRENVYI